MACNITCGGVKEIFLGFGFLRERWEAGWTFFLTHFEAQPADNLGGRGLSEMDGMRADAYVK